MSASDPQVGDVFAEDPVLPSPLGRPILIRVLEVVPYGLIVEYESNRPPHHVWQNTTSVAALRRFGRPVCGKTLPTPTWWNRVERCVLPIGHDGWCAEDRYGGNRWQAQEALAGWAGIDMVRS